MAIKYLMLDLDDTLLDFHKSERIALGKTFSEFGISPTDEIMAMYSSINRECWQRLERLEMTRDEVLFGRFAILFSKLGIDADEREVQKRYEDNLSYEAYFLDGAEDLLRHLFGKFKLYVASNGTAVVQDRRISLSGIGKYFDGLFISQRIGADKPSVRFFERAAQEMGNPPADEVMIVGDSLSSDIRGGIDAGIHTCWFNPQSKDNGTGIIPEYEIRSYGELYEILNIE